MAPTVAAPTSEQLGGLLLTVEKLPVGWEVKSPDTTMDVGPAVPECESLSSGYEFVRHTGTPIGHASTIMRYENATTGASAIADEYLLSYAGDGAHQALQQVSKLVADCPVFTFSDTMSSSFSTEAGPALGDESLVIHARNVDSQDPAGRPADTTVVRCGTVLVVITKLPTQASDLSQMTQLVPDAVHAFITGP